jgi:L-ascorbate metabolism protein UlaG (beta-lactamase superfamily)
LAAAARLDALPPIDVILLSHNHYDHLDRRAVQRIARRHPHSTWIVPLGLRAAIHRWGAREIVELDWWDDALVGALRVTATPARRSSARGIADRIRTLWCGFALETPATRLFFAGDTAYHPEFGVIGARCGPFDLVMIPVGAYEPRWIMEGVHVNPDEAVRIYQELSLAHPGVPPPLMLAIHWGTFPLTTEPIDEPRRRVTERWRELELNDDALWIARFGETRTVARCPRAEEPGQVRFNI